MAKEIHSELKKIMGTGFIKTATLQTGGIKFVLEGCTTAEKDLTIEDLQKYTRQKKDKVEVEFILKPVQQRLKGTT